MEDLDLATAAVYPLRHEAEIAKARLASEGIPSIVSADDEGGLNPGFFAEYGIRLVVRREQLSQAEAILTETLDAANDGIYLERGHLDAFVAHARFCAPQEGCGLVAFDASGGIRFVYCLTNVDRSRYRFTVDPTEHFRAIQHAERNGWEIAGAFHSHPEGPAVPSVTDIEAAGDSSWLHIVVGLANRARPEVRAFAITGGSAAEVLLHAT